MHSLTALIALAAAVTTASASVSRGPWNSVIQCGCDYMKDADIDECQAAIDQIDASSNSATDPANGIETVHTGPLSSDTIMYKSGNCGVGVGNVQTIGGPGGIGGVITGTTATGQVVKDIMQAILDGCQNKEKGVVNGCAGLGDGNLDLGKH